jgi:predicted dehydrogenase
LRRELEDFVDAVRTGRSPGVTGRDGRDALALATRVAEKMESGFATETQRIQL